VKRIIGIVRRISFIRLFLVLLVVAAILAGSSWWVSSEVSQSKSGSGETWFAPYIDATLPPFLHFEDPIEQPALDVVLGFIVADPRDPCLPSWGTYYDLDAAARALDMDRRIVRLVERGGSAIVSFGGAVNDELATACADLDDLVEAYQSVIDRYDLKVLDFDIEGGAITNVEANERRAIAMRRLQEANPGLQIWLTVPVAPFGMTAEGVALVDVTLAASVELAGVNVMTMDYGGSRTPEMSMREATLQALNHTWQQLDGAYQRQGTPLTQREVWSLIGATPMIGQNDVPAEVFTLADAEWLSQFAAQNGLGRLSFWSANRDTQCGPDVVEGRVSNTCSGVQQEPLEFSLALATGAASNRSPALGAAEVQPTAAVEGSAEGRAGEASRDDPTTSPYPIWRAAKVYEEGDKVVWQNRVYQAKWWTQSDQPDAPVRNVWDTPWRYLGPVLEIDREIARARVADAKDRPNWNSESVYLAGDEVEYEDQVFRAKWWTQANVPQEDPDQPYDHPWEYIGDVAAPTPTPTATASPPPPTPTPTAAPPGS
jgi:chitinase